MQVILREDIDKLGHTGDVAEVKQGYARNYLLPRNLAMPVTQENLKSIEKEKVRREVQRAEQEDAAKSVAEKLASVSLTLTATAAEGGHLYGSVGRKEISEGLQKEGFDVSPEQILLDTPFKELGVYNVKARLHRETEAEFKVWVVEQ